MKINKVGIILRKDSQETITISNELQRWFSAKNIEVFIDQISADLQLLIILGGDGTLLHVADQASKYGIPVVGVNLGDLGFLTEVSVDERIDALETILAGDFDIEDRMMLKVRLCSDQGKSEWMYGLNDVVISKGSVDRLVQLRSWADHDYITTYRADGLVFSTPTGSTAYNLSAGGPIVHPCLQAILVTPICPFMLESRPVLLPANCCVSTSLIGGEASVQVIVDGKQIWSMNHEDVLEVCSSDKPLKLIGSPQKGYFQILRNKLNWGGRKDQFPSPLIGS